MRSKTGPDVRVVMADGTVSDFGGAAQFTITRGGVLTVIECDGSEHYFGPNGWRSVHSEGGLP